MVALTIPDSKIIKRYFFISCYLSYKQFLIASNPFLRYSYQNWTLNKKFESTYKGIISFQFISDVSQFIHEIIESHMHTLKIHISCITSHGFFIILEVIAFQSNGKPLMLQIWPFPYSCVHDLVFTWIKAQILRQFPPPPVFVTFIKAVSMTWS